ncbi:GNAT family N-acetyltransferase [Marivita hallyeonensis]|uniref:Protein N-acetyltransferase, RimJ/RimL family n=1 Tax=Marivita hallyeonensis TaxID=996342 RepID=A0A1M5XEU6_9RHOB|nr:GNAT family N-acetyltransferase [Marivita hallyeonensis]SHH98024.1 Protein N-acetyltransferase, RimJ/RimL family [Marivita hallyeonensis]
MTPPTLTTKRLVMRAPTDGDRAAYHAFYAVTDLAVGHYRGGRSEAEVDAILRRDMDHWVRNGFGIWLLRTHGADAVLGGVGLDHTDGWPGHEVTWWLMPDTRGHGYATEAAQAAIDWAYEQKHWPKVQTFFRDENTASRRVAERLGGTFDRRLRFPDGVERDIYVFPQRVTA